MHKNEPITSIISEDVVSAEEGHTFSHVSQIMSDYGIHHVPVVDEGKLIGIVSFTDMLKLELMVSTAPRQTIGAILDTQFTIKGVMTKDVVSINKNDTIYAATRLLASGKFHSLPVVDDDNVLVGIVTSTDLIRYLREQY